MHLRLPEGMPDNLSIREAAALMFLRATKRTDGVGDREIELLLQKQFAWSRTTARKVIDRLLERGLIGSDRGDAA